MIDSLAARLQALQASDPHWTRTWVFAAGLLGTALLALLLLPTWGWTMLAVAPLYLFVHRGELGGRTAGGAAARARTASADAPAARGVALLDREGRVAWCNDASARHLGLSRASNGAQNGAHRLAALGCGLSRTGGERQVLRNADGVAIAVECLPFIDSDLLVISREVRSEQGAREEDPDTCRRFIADASHELRNPLSVMMGLLETVTELDLDGERRAYYLNLMDQQGRRMQAIVEGLLKLSKLESLPEPRREDRVDMGLLLARIRAEAEVLSCGRHSISLEADESLHLMANEQEISSAIGNLVSNAIRYTLPGGEIRVSWRRHEGGAAFTVEDTGIGIEPAHIPRLTERFYRVDEARARDAGGTGLGLSIVKLVLERHGARLEVTSAPGKGSRFRAVFPGELILSAPAERAPRARACATC